MLSIKLKPVGRKHQITYRVVVAEKRSKLKGKYVEDIGWVDPHQGKFKIDEERAKYWIEVGGAQPTDTVYNLLVKVGAIKGPKRPVHAKKKTSGEDVKEVEGEGKAVSGELTNEVPSEEKIESKEEAEEETPKGEVKEEEKEKEDVSEGEASEKNQEENNTNEESAEGISKESEEEISKEKEKKKSEAGKEKDGEEI